MNMCYDHISTVFIEFVILPIALYNTVTAAAALWGICTWWLIIIIRVVIL